MHIWLTQYFCNNDHSLNRWDASTCQIVIIPDLHWALMSNNQIIFIHEERTCQDPLMWHTHTHTFTLSHTHTHTHTHTHRQSFVSNCCLPWGWHPTWELNPVNAHYLSFPFSLVCSLLLHSFSEFSPSSPRVSANPGHRSRYLRREQQGGVMRDHSLAWVRMRKYPHGD